MALIAFVMVLLGGFRGDLIQYFRFVLLLSAIIPISLRVNLDFAKAYFSFKISNDEDLGGTAQARNSGIPEELGRI
jgi:phospholipid-translocating ATPase